MNGESQPVARRPQSLDGEALWRVFDVGRALLTERGESPVLERALETAQELTGARYAALAVLDPGLQQVEKLLTRGVGELVRHRIGRLPLGDGLLGALIDSHGPVRIADVEQHPRASGFPPGHPRMHSFLGVPILVRGEAWGSLYLTEKPRGEFSQADEDAVVLLASWAAIAIEHARLEGAALTHASELEQAVRGLRAIQEIALAIGADTSVKHILELVVERGRTLVGARTLVALLVEGAELVAVAAAGDGEGIAGHRLAIETTLCGEVLRHGRPERVDDVLQLSRECECLGLAEGSSAMLTPMVFGREPMGLLIAFDRSGGAAFGSEDEQALRAFAASAAIAVQNAQTVAAEFLAATLSAAEEERRRWARELHDETLQSLGALRLQLAGARRRGSLDAWERAGNEAIGQIERDITNLRAIITELRPPALDQLGLADALEALAEHHETASGFDVSSDVALPAGSLGAELETTIYRLVQEALMNVARHARARNAHMAVVIDDRQIKVEVRDDGIGFDPLDVAGFGLAGMRERIALVSGELAVESGSRGTMVRATIPAPKTWAFAHHHRSPSVRE